MPNDQIMKESSLSINQVNQFKKCACGTSKLAIIKISNKAF